MISIIMPTYNRGYCISRAINSVLNQTIEEWELIIVDGSSTDDTQKIVENYMKLDRRIKYIVQSGEGVNNARNEGIRYASGEYICFLDSDDELVPTALEETLNLIKKYNVWRVSTNGEFSNIRSRTVRYTRSSDDLSHISYYDFIRGKISGEMWGLMRSDILKKYMFPEDLMGMESVTWYQIRKKYIHELFLNKPLRIYHTDSNDRIMDNISKSKISSVVLGYIRILSIIKHDLIRYNYLEYIKIMLTVSIYGSISSRIYRTKVGSFLLKESKFLFLLYNILILFDKYIYRMYFTIKSKKLFRN